MKVVRFSVYESKTTWFEVPEEHFDSDEIQKINSEKINLQDVTYKKTTKLSDILYGKTEVEYIQHEDVDVQEFALVGDDE